MRSVGCGTVSNVVSSNVSADVVGMAVGPKSYFGFLQKVEYLFRASTMKEQLQIEFLIAAIRKAFADAPPNGWLLEWDEMRAFERIKIAAHPFHCENYTSFDYSFCNHYGISTRTESRNVKYWVLTVRLSFIANVYCMHWTEYSPDGRSGHVITTISDGALQSMEARVKAEVERAGFVALPDEWLDVPIRGVTLELSDQDKVTLSKCLFEDYSA